MAQHQISTSYEIFDQLSGLSQQEQLLVQKAIEARQNAYAPYSGFQVGAAILLDNGEIVTGNNQENAAYPSGLCAERVAVFYANATFPNQKIVKLALAGGKGQLLNDAPISPCGACRQVLLESEWHQKMPFEIIMAGEKQIIKIKSAASLLPFEFNGEALGDEAAS
jgi:cytidine deaminase